MKEIKSEAKVNTFEVKMTLPKKDNEQIEAQPRGEPQKEPPITKEAKGNCNDKENRYYKPNKLFSKEKIRQPMREPPKSNESKNINDKTVESIKSNVVALKDEQDSKLDCDKNSSPPENGKDNIDYETSQIKVTDKNCCNKNKSEQNKLKTTDVSEQKPAKPTSKAGSFLKRLRGIKHIEIIAALLVCAILMLVYAGVSSTKKTTVKEIEKATAEIEQELAAILSQISGVGKTSVMITYQGGSQIEIACKTDRKTDTDANGSSTTTESSVPIIITKDGASVPLVLKEIAPAVEGIIVVAEGGSSAEVRFKITQAICTALKVDSSKIQVFSMK